ncbi:MAG: FtsQ-type POTRA domain-containing protein [Dehalococcoidia bacterium]
MPRFRLPQLYLGGGSRRPPSRAGLRYAGSPVGMHQPSHNPLGRVPWTLVALGLGAAAVMLVLAVGVLSLTRSSLFRVHEVQVLGAEIVDAKAIEAAANLGNRSLFNLGTDDAAKRVEALSGVAQARVHADWPSGAVIDVSERQGWGYWQVLGFRAVIDADGRVVDVARKPADNAPTIYQVGATQPLEPGATVDRDSVALVTRLLTDGTFMRLGLKPQRFDFEKSRGLVVRMDGGPAAVFGDSHDYEFKVAAWVAANTRVRTDRMTANEIDLRFGKELVVR